MSLNPESCRYLCGKSEYGAVDFFRMLCALSIASIHLYPLSDLNIGLCLWHVNVLCRYAVPFFAFISGYFVQPKTGEARQFYAYILKILKMYALYSLIYLPQVIYNFIKTGVNLPDALLKLLTNFLYFGTFGHFWYFPAIIFAALFYRLLRYRLRFPLWLLTAAALAIYCVGTFFNEYTSYVSTFPRIKPIMDAYINTFSTVRNGLFFCFPFFSLGCLVRERSFRIARGPYWLALLICAVLLFLEVRQAYIMNHYFQNEHDMYFALFPLTVSLFLALAFIPCPQRLLPASLYVRRLSALFFGLHLFVKFYLFGLLSYVLHIKLHSLLNYYLVVCITLCLSALIIKLSEKPRLSWLKLLY